VALPIPPLVASGPFEQEVMGMDIDFDGPLQIDDGHIDANGSATRELRESVLSGNGNASVAQRREHSKLGVRFGG